MCRNRTLTTMRLAHAEVRRGSLCISTRFHRINVTSHIPTSYRKLKIRCNNPFRSHTQHHMHSRTMGYTNFRRKLCHCLCTFPPKRNCRHDTSSLLLQHCSCRPQISPSPSWCTPGLLLSHAKLSRADNPPLQYRYDPWSSR